MSLNASFADFKIVKTRGVAQLVFEVDLAQADAALALLGGVPRPEQERWVSIAPVADGARVVVTPGPEQPPVLAKAGRPAPSDGERIRTRAVLLCKDEQFQRWVWERMNYGTKSEEDARGCILDYCRIGSRSLLATVPVAQQRFLDLEAQYRAETGQMAERMG
jgi:hypothetical protein